MWDCSDIRSCRLKCFVHPGRGTTPFLITRSSGRTKNRANTKEDHQILCFAFLLPSLRSEIINTVFDSRIISCALHRNFAMRQTDWGSGGGTAHFRESHRLFSVYPRPQPHSVLRMAGQKRVSHCNPEKIGKYRRGKNKRRPTASMKT